MASPSQFAPAPAKKSGGIGKILLIGCGIVLALGLLVGIAIGVGIYLNKDQIAQTINETASTMNDEMDAQMEQAIPQYMALLTKGHSQAKKDAFEQALRKTMIDSRHQLGATTWAPVSGELMQSLADIMSDGKITTKESKAWVDEVDQKLSAAGYTE